MHRPDDTSECQYSLVTHRVYTQCYTLCADYKALAIVLGHCSWPVLVAGASGRYYWLALVLLTRVIRR